jgi:hypothetical protein
VVGRFVGSKSYKLFELQLARLQWLNRRKVIGSANWKKAQIQIARLQAKNCQHSQRHIAQAHNLPSPKPQQDRH